MSIIADILKNSRTIAVVGLSANPERPSNVVATYLKEKGFKIVPVNPGEKTILGETSYPDLTSVPVKIDVVDIFRQSEAVPPIVKEAIKIGAKAVWMQEGVINKEAASEAEKAGLKVVMDKCMRKEHMKLSGSGSN
jgi:predicted CoA-binding protein